MKIGTKIYFEKNTGNKILELGDIEGYVVDSTTAEDFENYAELQKYDKTAVGKIQLQYGELDKLLKENKANSYKVDVTEENAKLVFSWIDYATGEPAEKPKTEVELLKEELEKTKLEYAASLAEIIEKTEKDKLELSTAIVELMEQSIK